MDQPRACSRRLCWQMQSCDIRPIHVGGDAAHRSCRRLSLSFRKSTLPATSQACAGMQGSGRTATSASCCTVLPERTHTRLGQESVLYPRRQQRAQRPRLHGLTDTGRQTRRETQLIQLVRAHARSTCSACQRTSVLTIDAWRRCRKTKPVRRIITQNMANMIKISGTTSVAQIIPYNFKGQDPYTACPC